MAKTNSGPSGATIEQVRGPSSATLGQVREPALRLGRVREPAATADNLMISIRYAEVITRVKVYRIFFTEY